MNKNEDDITTVFIILSIAIVALSLYVAHVHVTTKFLDARITNIEAAK